MNTPRTLPCALLAAAGMTLALGACDRSQPDADAHDRAPDGADHSHADTDHAHDADAHDHAIDAPPVSITIAGTTFSAVVDQQLVPGSELHADFTVTDGPAPAALRIWVGDEAATGTMKAKADRDGSAFHAHAPVPDTLAPGAQIWIEVQADDGTRTAAPLTP